MLSFFEISPPVPEKKISEGFCIIHGHGGHLGHVTLIIYININNPFLLMLHITFGYNRASGYRGEAV